MTCRKKAKLHWWWIILNNKKIPSHPNSQWDLAELWLARNSWEQHPHCRQPCFSRSHIPSGTTLISPTSGIVSRYPSVSAQLKRLLLSWHMAFPTWLPYNPSSDSQQAEREVKIQEHSGLHQFFAERESQVEESVISAHQWERSSARKQESAGSSSAQLPELALSNFNKGKIEQKIQMRLSKIFFWVGSITRFNQTLEKLFCDKGRRQSNQS